MQSGVLLTGQCVVGVCGVCNDFFGFHQVATVGNVCDGSNNDLLSVLHHSLQGLVVHGRAALSSNGDAVCQDALNHVLVESGVPSLAI